MIESPKTSEKEIETIDLYTAFDNLYEKKDEWLSNAVIMELAFLELLNDLEKGVYIEMIGDSDPENHVWQALSLPENLKTKYDQKKAELLGAPSEKIAELLKRRMSNNGRDFCEKIQYCKRKAQVEEIKYNVKQFLKDVTKVGAYGGVVWIRFKSQESEIEIITEEGAESSTGELLETVGEAVGIVKDVGTEVLATGLDTVVPLSLVVRITKSSLDKLCLCCKKCQGIGVDENEVECGECEGSGNKTPYPKE